MSGEEFHQTWMRAMIVHHKGVLKMADTVKTEGESAFIQELADAIIQTQKSKIDTLELLLNLQIHCRSRRPIVGAIFLKSANVLE